MKTRGRGETVAGANRRELRYLVEVPLVLRHGRRSWDLVTEDISHGGLFVRLQELVDLQQLVSIELLLPPKQTPFGANGRVAHHVPAVGGDQDSGIGIEFYGLGVAPRQAWDAFVEHVRKTSPESSERIARLVRAEPIDPLFRRDPSQAAVLRIHVREIADLVRILRRDLHQKRMFVLTRAELAPGAKVGLQIVHPHTEDVFELSAVVTRRVEGAVGGVDLSLDVGDQRATRFEEFVFDALAPMFDEESLG